LTFVDIKLERRKKCTKKEITEFLEKEVCSLPLVGHTGGNRTSYASAATKEAWFSWNYGKRKSSEVCLNQKVFFLDTKLNFV
jgi:hypothetical protein